MQAVGDLTNASLSWNASRRLFPDELCCASSNRCPCHRNRTGASKSYPTCDATADGRPWSCTPALPRHSLVANLLVPDNCEAEILWDSWFNLSFPQSTMN